MKKRFLISLLCGLTLAGAGAQELEKGDIIADFGFGVGLLKTPDKKATFTQRLGVEYIFKDDLELFGKTFKAGLGLGVTNSFCRPGDQLMLGVYDYDYNVVRTGVRIVDGKRQQFTDVTTQNRKGAGIAEARQTRSDMTFLPEATIHFEPMSGLDVYATLGLGLGLMNRTSGEKRPLESVDMAGFGAANYEERTDFADGGFETVRVRYDDMEHSKWYGERGTEATFGMAIYAGARYWINQRLAANLQVGMVSGAIKKSMGSNYNLVTFGASWKF